MYQSEGERDHGDASSENSGEQGNAGRDDDNASMRDEDDAEGDADGQGQADDEAPTTPQAASGAARSTAGGPARDDAAMSEPARDAAMPEPASHASTPVLRSSGGGKRRGKQTRGAQEEHKPRQRARTRDARDDT